MATTQTPCEKCWKRSGDEDPRFAPLLLCFGCKSDLDTAMNFLSAKGWKIQLPLPRLADEAFLAPGPDGSLEGPFRRR